MHSLPCERSACPDPLPSESLSPGQMSWKAKCQGYVIRCQCRDGGFCFYRSDYSEESNLYDAGWALASLHVLGAEPSEMGALKNWLAQQSAALPWSGSLTALWSYERTIRFLGQKREADLRATAERLLASFRLPSEEAIQDWDASGLLRDLSRLAELCEWLCLTPAASWRSKLASLLSSLRGESGAFLKDRENLIDSRHAWTVCRIFSLPVDLQPLLPLASRKLGLSPLSSPFSAEAESLEGILSGLTILAACRRRPKGDAKTALTSQIEGCQADSGGFGRRIGAIPTLEDTYYGASSLLCLEQSA
ncbi:MAG: prenyltransferase/squalene oxidase repeat-containing protein [Candidatus Methylacidiphilaceae bacterium]